MAQVNFTFPDLRELVTIRKEDAIETLTSLGFPAEETGKEDELTVEVTPNRPDCLCVEGLARALHSYQTGKAKYYEVAKGKVEVDVNPTVANVRPAFGGAVVRDVRMADAFLRSLMQVQEKLHDTLGRKRRKIAIGIHDFDRVQPPFRYFACGRKDVQFVPLEMEEKMTPEQILLEHPKGVDYAHLVGERCPMIEDSNQEILSFPPIINGELTKLTDRTRNLFIDCTGTSEEAVKQTVNILVAMLSERGGKIEEILINGKPYPLLQEHVWPVPAKQAERLLGIKLSHATVCEYLQKMGHRIAGDAVHVPGYRVDVMNEVDLVEDVAIAYGFNNFEPSLPEFASVGKASPESVFHELLLGLGYDEVMSWTLSNPAHERKAGIPHGSAVEIENPLAEDFTAFRTSILPNILTVLSDSKNEKLPIRIYEEGAVGAPQLENRLCIASMHPKASFSEIKGAVLAIAKAAGLEISIEKEEFGPFIFGRSAAVYLNGKKAGYLGEISPEVLENFSLEQPVCAAELRVS